MVSSISQHLLLGANRQMQFKADPGCLVKLDGRVKNGVRDF